MLKKHSYKILLLFITLGITSLHATHFLDEDEGANGVKGGCPSSSNFNANGVGGRGSKGHCKGKLT